MTHSGSSMHHSGLEVITQAFTLNVLGLGAANIAIGPLFVSIGNVHPMLIDAKNTAPPLAVQKNDAIGNFVSVTPIPPVARVEGYAGRPAPALEANQVAEIQSSYNGPPDIPVDETVVFPTGVGDEREIGCVGRCTGCPDAQRHCKTSP